MLFLAVALIILSEIDAKKCVLNILLNPIFLKTSCVFFDEMIMNIRDILIKIDFTPRCSGLGRKVRFLPRIRNFDFGMLVLVYAV